MALRTFNVGGRQGRGDPVRGESSPSSTESTKGLFTSRAFWISAIACGLLWGLVLVGWLP